jgi:patatin-like phospholipase/acyl hydrolase
MTSKPYSILSLDGGGIRGLVTAIMLESLEKQIKKRAPRKQLRDCFDLIAGTSSGSLIACGISHGLQISEIRNFYSLNSQYPQKIFPESKFNLVFQGIVNRFSRGSSQPLYNGKGLEDVLKYLFKKDTFSQLPIQTLVTSYDVYNGQAVVFNSRQEECQTLPIWEVCRASAAAPVAFPAHVLKNIKFLKYWQQQGYQLTVNNPKDNQECIPLIDGGLVANNPTLCAIAEAIKNEQHLSNIVVSSFGCGQKKVKSIGVQQAQESGAFEWIYPLKSIPLLETFFEGSSDAIDHISQHLIKRDDQHYFRFQPSFTENYPAFEATARNLDELTDNTLEFINSRPVQEKLNLLADKLTVTPVSPVREREEQLVSVSHYN